MVIIDTYEEVLDFTDKIKDIIEDVPDFEKSLDCEDWLTDVLKICHDWLEENQEEYLNERRLEERELSREFDKQRT